jgi:hypothetical protein
MSTTNHSHLQYQQQPPLTFNINNNPLSPPISTTTHSDLQEWFVVDIGGEKGLLLLILEVQVGSC